MSLLQRPMSLHQRQQQKTGFFPHRTILLLALLVLLGVFLPWTGTLEGLFFSSTDREGSLSRWRDHTLAQAAAFVARNGTLIVCAVSQPFLNNWLISIARQRHHENVLVIAEDYSTLYNVNQRWPGHAVLIPPAPDAQTAHKFGSQLG